MSTITIANPAFLSYLHSFRGFAIINIVAVHAFAFSNWKETMKNPKNPISVVNEFLFHNSTIYFAHISGLLSPVF